MKSNSFFLIGPRGSGKTFLLNHLFQPDKVLWVNLLDDNLSREYIANPRLLEERITPSTEWVVIDEVQKVPSLLDFVHKLIEERKIKFALTGSSARKLKRQSANLLAGRAFFNHLHPLTFEELGSDFNLDDVLHWGSLPKIFGFATALEKKEYLRAYVSLYLKEEIREEQAVRKIEPFVRFLEVAAQCNGTILNHSKIGRDAGVDSKAIERYFQILEETLLGFYLEPFHFSVRKRQTQKAKFYFFDTGVTRATANLLNVNLQKGTYAYGNAFEHFFILEVIRLNHYYKKDYKLSYLRTKDDLEVDLIIERPGEKILMVEVKSSELIDESEFRHQKEIQKDLDHCDFWIASQERQPRTIDGLEILPWQVVLERLFAK